MMGGEGINDATRDVQRARPLLPLVFKITDIRVFTLPVYNLWPPGVFLPEIFRTRSNPIYRHAYCIYTYDSSVINTGTSDI